MIITLKDGSKREYSSAMTAGQIAKSISESLFRNALCAKVNGVVCDLSQMISSDAKLEILTYQDDEAKEVYRHTCSHILAHAVKSMFPTVKLAIGPATNTGFYYDFDFKTPITQDDLAAIETEMAKIIKADFEITRTEFTKRKAVNLIKTFDEPYKLDILNSLPDGVPYSFYQQGNFNDLCSGPHLPSTGKIKAFKLISLTGAYFKGDEKNKMLSRIYGVAFDKKSELDAYLEKLELAKKRDHNKLGRDLDLFMTDETIGQGLPLLMPKGAKVLQILQRFVEDEEARRGYQFTKTPFMAKSDLYKISGHWQHYKDGMFVLGDEKVENSEILALRPMTCPFQFTMYKNGQKSYRDLPIRYGETATLFRNESSGEMHGLIRVRQFTLSDGHIICLPEQLEDEFRDAYNLVLYFLECLGIKDDVTFRLSKWDSANKEKYIDNPQAWEHTQQVLKRILDDIGVKYSEADGEAAFYGPKLDIQACNVYGKEDTIITIQLDFALAERFEMYYVDSDGAKKHPYIIHRSSIGCYERTLAMLIEKYGGAFPLWLSPVQVKLLGVTDRVNHKIKEITDKLRKNNIRVEADLRNEKIGYKIREAQIEKIPYMLVIGDNEVENNTVSVRCRQNGDLGSMTVESLIQMLEKQVSEFK